VGVLEATDVVVSFGGNRALDSASVVAPEGQITGLIGPNGAGKTTLFNAITGLVTPSSGRITLDGVDITRKSMHRRARAGLARTFQQLELFTMLSVRENIRVAADIHHRWGPPCGRPGCVHRADPRSRRPARRGRRTGHHAVDGPWPAGRAGPCARLRAERAAPRRTGVGPERCRDRPLRAAPRRAGRRWHDDRAGRTRHVTGDGGSATRSTY
jgi:ABC-type sugar transport system ATPase subunit